MYLLNEEKRNRERERYCFLAMEARRWVFSRINSFTISRGIPSFSQTFTQLLAQAHSLIQKRAYNETTQWTNKQKNRHQNKKKKAQSTTVTSGWPATKIRQEKKQTVKNVEKKRSTKWKKKKSNWTHFNHSSGFSYIFLNWIALCRNWDALSFFSQTTTADISMCFHSFIFFVCSVFFPFYYETNESCEWRKKMSVSPRWIYPGITIKTICVVQFASFNLCRQKKTWQKKKRQKKNKEK